MPFQTIKLWDIASERIVWEVDHDRDMAGNSFANAETLHRTYNSFHPRGE